MSSPTAPPRRSRVRIASCLGTDGTRVARAPPPGRLPRLGTTSAWCPQSTWYSILPAGLGFRPSKVTVSVGRVLRREVVHVMYIVEHLHDLGGGALFGGSGFDRGTHRTHDLVQIQVPWAISSKRSVRTSASCHRREATASCTRGAGARRTQDRSLGSSKSWSKQYGLLVLARLVDGHAARPWAPGLPIEICFARPRPLLGPICVQRFCVRTRGFIVGVIGNPRK